MTVQLFFNPELVGQLAACGITARRRAPERVPTAGFVLDRRSTRAPSRAALTNVIAVRGHVTITGARGLDERPAAPALPATTPQTTPQTPLELVEENARLRRDNQRLLREIERLRSDVARLSAGPIPPHQPAMQDLDDASTRFSLLELDL